MQSTIGHLQINIAPQNQAFYKDLFCFLGWSVWYEDPSMLGVGTPEQVSLWFAGQAKPAANDYDGVGMNHLGIAVKSAAEVDQAAGYLRERGISALFDTPRHRPEFCSSPAETYYQVMFESPDRILFEVVYTGPNPDSIHN